MMESENLLDTQWRKFGKCFAYSVLVVLFFYLYLYINVKYVSHRLFALPIYLIIIGITLTGHTIFLLHQSTFDFLKIYRFILFFIFHLYYLHMLGFIHYEPNYCYLVYSNNRNGVIT